MGTKSQTLALLEEQQKQITRPERLFHEINLLYLEGHYFTFDKASKPLTNALEDLNRRWQHPEINTVEPISVSPHPDYGTPSFFAYKVFQAVLKKLSDYGHPAPESVSFGHREIMRLIGRASYGGKDSKELMRVLHQLRNTEINCWMYDRATEEASNLSFSLATTFLYTFKKRGQVSHFSIYLHPFIIKSINNLYTFCLNFGRMEALEPISMALFKHIYFHFSNIYSSKPSKDFSFRKDYADICRTWLGGLKPVRYKAKVKERLGKYCDALKETGLIKSYAIEKNADGDGFNLIFRPGPGFFEDYDRYYARRFQREIPFLYTADATAIQHPQEMVLYFYRKLYDTNEVDELGFTERETAFAASLLEKHDTKEIQAFIDYALQEAKKTNFDIKTFGGIKKYYLPYTRELSQLEHKNKLEDGKRRKQEEQQALASYNLYYQEVVEKIRAAISEEELTRLESQVRTELEGEHPGSKILTAWVRHRVNRLLAKKHKVSSFGDWKERCG